MSQAALSVVASRIKEAVERVNAGELERALALYEHVFDPLPDGRAFQVPAELRLDFVYRRVDLLRRLGRSAAALALVDSEEVIAWAAAPAHALERHLRRGDLLVYGRRCKRTPTRSASSTKGSTASPKRASP